MATKTVGRLKIQLDAVTNRFDQGMNKAGKKITKFQRVAAGAKKIIGGLTKVITGFGLALVGVGIAVGRMVGASLERLDTLAKTSSKLGIASEKLSGLQLAAQLTGVEVSALGDGIQKMQKNLAEAARGTGEAVESFELLGIRAQDLINLTPDEQFIAIAEAMQGVTTQADKMEIAMAIFGRGGGGLLNTLALGAEGLREQQEEAEKLGIAFSSLDLAKIEGANDAILKVKTSLQALADKFTVALAPTITAVSSMFTEWATSGTMSSSEIEKSIDGLIGKLEKTEALLSGIKALYHGTVGIGKKAAAASFVPLEGLVGITGADPKVGGYTDIALRYAEELRKGSKKSLEKADKAFITLGKSKALGGTGTGVGSGISSTFNEIIKRTAEERAKAEAKAKKREAEIEAEKARSKQAQQAAQSAPAPSGLARGGTRIGGTGADGQWRGDPQTERSANLLQHIIDNGIPLAVGSTP